MLLITHAVIGATVATKVKNPFISLPLVFALHFLADYLPHWDVGSGHNRRTLLHNFLLALTDGITALLVVFFLFQYQRSLSPLIWLGTGASLLPDFLEAPYVFFDCHLIPFLDRLHSGFFHHQSSSILAGLIPQLLLIFICIWLTNVSSPF